jgi:lipoprotein-anchoring transpeptidase ErfK/SrfK
MKRGVPLIVAAVLLALPACSSSSSAGSPAAASSPGTSAAAPSASPSPSAVPLSLAVTPAANTANLPVTTEIGTTVAGGKVSDVKLVTAAGKAVAGGLRQDGSSWVPAAPLEWKTGYTATVTALGPDGKTTTKTTSFTTMTRPGGSRVGSGLYVQSGMTYGVAMPIAVEFESDIPDSARAAVQRRLLVQSDPPQVGAWHWFSARQVLYRPQNYWLPGTRLSVRSALAGLPIGKRFGDRDRSATATIANRKLVIEVDNATKQMTVYQNDAVVKTMPVSLGKPSTPSASGTMVIMAKDEQTVFDTTNEGPNGYRVNIAYAQRLTWSGQFIHAAPWSVKDQGHRNVSHGCVNVAMGNAKYLFDLTLVGDPVTVRGTEEQLQPGDGWTAWNMSWQDFVK